MRRSFKFAVRLLGLAVVVPILCQCSSANAPSKANSAKEVAETAAGPPEPAPLKVGDKAPDFTLPDQYGKDISLSQFQGKKNVVLAFYVLAFTGG